MHLQDTSSTMSSVEEPQEAFDSTSPFESVDPSAILEQLATLEPEECLNGKKFWKTYGVKWETLRADQRNKTMVRFAKLFTIAARF
jgi:anti-sigma factor ChrR (cupin superfamily)